MVAAAPVRIAWDNLKVGEWASIVRAAGRSTLTQTFAYAAAMLQAERRRSTVGLIELDDRPVGVVLGMRRRAMGFADLVSIERGPLFLPEAFTPEIVAGAMAAIRTRFPPGLARWTQFIPELPAHPRVAEILQAARFRRADGDGYRTVWLDLAPDDDALRRGLRKEWRNRLRLAERAEAAGRLSVEVDPKARTLPELVRPYLADREARKYRGPDGPLVVRLRNAAAAEGGAVLATARVEGRLVAGVLLLVHGAAATYQIGWTGPEGRELSATHLCLWRGIAQLRASGVRWFDLGGIEPRTAPGVTFFKRGMGGEEVELCGTWV
jgi:hypothetical protein